MRTDGWLAALAAELHRHGLGSDLTGHVVAEAAAHLRDSGESPLAAFGPPDTYAAAVAASVGGPTPAPPGRVVGPVRLAARGITKRYRRRTVLADVDLTVRAGEVAAVIGANGSGKSTLLRICAGLARPDRGTVRIDGRLGYCPQDGGVSDFLTADEHFVLIGAGRGLDRSAARRAGLGQATALDWAPKPGVLARHLSGGTRQKLNLSLARLGTPDVLLLDEPYQGFDRGSYLDFWHQVWRWRDGGTAIVVVTHLLNQLDRVDTVLDLTRAEAAA
ncbi:ATP-binding cassette domain-containing protein [Actinocatenispora sera]|uniref:ATP-binding cassette domain-containing protein n=1 Tax=Actinocatenispora sera TaxID=390989 RepID=UPI0033F0B382